MPQELTEDDVDRAMIETKLRWQLADSVAQGLLLRAGKTPAWLLRITRRGVLKLTLGYPPLVGLDTARVLAREAMADHLAGKTVDPEWVRAAHVRHRIREPAPVVVPYVEPAGPWTWEEAAEAWLRSLEARRRSPVTVASYRKSVLTVLAEFRPRLVRDVTIEDVQEALETVAATYPALAAQALKAARPFSQWLFFRKDKSGFETHRYRRLELPDPEDRRPRGWQPVSLTAVAKLIAMARLGVLTPVVSRALEVIVWTGLPRSAVVPTRHTDIVDGVLTVRPELLKRKDAIRLPLHPRLQELLSCDADDVWVFRQPRQPHRGKPAGHVPVEGLGRATWELPGVPTASEVRLSMTDWLSKNATPNPDAGLLSDSGGNDNATDENGVPVWQRRGWLLDQWYEAVEPFVADQAATLDADEIKAAMRAKRPYKG